MIDDGQRLAIISSFVHSRENCNGHNLPYAPDELKILQPKKNVEIAEHTGRSSVQGSTSLVIVEVAASAEKEQGTA